MICPRCGHDNPKEAELCLKCRGVRFVRVDASKGRSDRLPKQTPAPAPGPVSQPTAPPQDRHVLTRVGAANLELDKAKTFTIGRDPSCSFAVPAKKVSRIHAEIRWEGESFVIADRGSANGTLVNGLPVQKRALVPGDEIQIGPFVAVYEHGDSQKARDSSGTVAERGEVVAGQIGAGGLAETLQALEFNQKTGTLSVFARGSLGTLLVQGGVPLRAEWDTVEGDEAIIAMLDLDQGRFAFVPELKETERCMRSTMTAILLEWGRRKDERKSSP